MFKKFLLALLCGVCAVSVMQAATPEAVARRQKFTAECGENAGKAAVSAGPVVYCVEGVDNGDLRGLFINSNTHFTVEYSNCYKTNIIKADAVRYKDNGSLYSSKKYSKETTEITLIPYFAFANRGESDMKVWINVE